MPKMMIYLTCIFYAKKKRYMIYSDTLCITNRSNMSPSNYLKQFAGVFIASFLLITGCTAMTDTTQTLLVQTQSNISAKTEKQAQWPLRFKSHWFSGYAFNTLECSVFYANFPEVGPFPGEVDKPSRSVESYGRPLDQLLSASRGPIINFPPPAQVTWKSKDGTPLSAQIDIGKIFADGLIRHNLTKEEISEGTLKSDNTPGIILEVNDRTINVYMRATLYTKVEQRPGHKHSDYRDDLIKVFNKSY
jgi:hypothetical protein